MVEVRDEPGRPNEAREEMTADTTKRIEEILRERFEPIYFELRDNSAQHAGHSGATSGGGHYHVFIVSAAFEGRTLLEQHRMVNNALKDMIGREIHGLGLKTLPPSDPVVGILTGKK